MGGGPQVKVYDGKTGGFLYSFWAFDPNFTGGITVASGRVLGDGSSQIVVAAGPLGGPEVAIFDGLTGNFLTSFFAYDSTFTGGVTLAIGNVAAAAAATRSSRAQVSAAVPKCALGTLRTAQMDQPRRCWTASSPIPRPMVYA